MISLPGFLLNKILVFTPCFQVIVCKSLLKYFSILFHNLCYFIIVFYRILTISTTLETPYSQSSVSVIQMRHLLCYLHKFFFKSIKVHLSIFYCIYKNNPRNNTAVSSILRTNTVVPIIFFFFFKF